MKKSLTKFVLISISIAMIGCQQMPLKYQLDPEIVNLDELASKAKMVALKVSDSRKPLNNDQSQLISGPINEAKLLQDKLINQLKTKKYKIINNILLADLAIHLEIIQLNLTIKKTTFKSIIYGKSEIKITVNKKNQQWSKIKKATRTQEVANPANNIDATGVLNQMLSQQLSSLFADKSLLEFVKKE